MKATEAHAVFRAGTIFPEMKKAEEWVESGSGSMNEGIDASVFEVLNLDYSGLTKVKRAYDIGDYYMALEELMNYYRSRTHGLNPNVDLSSVTPTANELRWADYAPVRTTIVSMSTITMMPQPVKMCLIRIRARAATASIGRSGLPASRSSVTSSTVTSGWFRRPRPTIRRRTRNTP